MSSQENVKITLKVSGKTVEIKPYVDARTSQANQAIYLKYANIDMKKAMAGADTGSDFKPEDIVNIDNLPADAIFETRQNSVKNMVVVYDGKKVTDRDQLLDELLDLPAPDYDQIVAEIDEITSETTLDPKGEQE